MELRYSIEHLEPRTNVGYLEDEEEEEEKNVFPIVKRVRL